MSFQADGVTVAGGQVLKSNNTGDEALNVIVDSVPLATDAATQTTLAAVLAKMIASPSTEAKQDTIATAIGLLAKLTDTQPVSAASLPLPSGAATATKQDTIATAIGLLAKLTDTQPVSASSLPLPSGAATSAKQDTLKSAVDLLAKLTDTQSVSAASLPLPSGASTEVTLASVATKLDTLLSRAVSEVDANNTVVAETVSTGSEWTGDPTDLTANGGYAGLTQNVKQDPAGAAGESFFEFSADGTTWDISIPTTLDGEPFILPLPLATVRKWYRSRVTNTSGADCDISVETILHRNAPADLTQLPHQAMGPTTPLKNNRALLHVEKFRAGTSIGFGNVEGNEASNLITADHLLEAAKGNVAGTSLVLRSGHNPDIDQVYETVWANGGIYAPPTSSAVITFTVNIADSSLGLTADVIGLDASGNLQSESVSLNAISVVTSNTYSALQSCVIDGATEPSFDITMAIGVTPVGNIAAGVNRTQLGYYHVPTGKTAYLVGLFTSTSNNSASNRLARLAVRPPGHTLFKTLASYGGHSQGGPTDVELTAPFTFLAGSVLRVDMICGANNNVANCNMELVLVDDS